MLQLGMFKNRAVDKTEEGYSDEYFFSYFTTKTYGYGKCPKISNTLFRTILA